MKIMFSKCSEAIERANQTKTFGCFYSDKHDANGSIHLHECCEILFCLSGGKTFFIDDRIYEVEDGDIFVLNQFEAHKITSDPGKSFERYVMQISPSFIYSASTSETDLSRCFTLRGDNVSHKIPTVYEERARLVKLFQKMSEDNGFGDDLLKSMAVIEFLTAVNALFFEKNKGYTYHSDYENKTMVRAIGFINENFANELSLDTVAKNSFISVNELCRLFKKHMGTTVNKYITSRRMTEAKKLLKGGASVSAAAEKSGYSDYANFIRSFKNAVGVTPGQYRKSEK